MTWAGDPNSTPFDIYWSLSAHITLTRSRHFLTNQLQIQDLISMAWDMLYWSARIIILIPVVGPDGLPVELFDHGRGVFFKEGRVP
jgi:hypothetical protein